MNRSSGFTIIELLISMTILSFIALAIYQNTTQSFNLRESVEQEGDFYNSVRVALDVLGRDISHIYSPQAAALPGDLGKAATPDPNAPNVAYAAPSSPATAFWGEPINQEGVRPSRFQGEATKISFVINSHMRLFRDTAESDFAKISYFLEDDKFEPKNGRVLVKKEDPSAFDDSEKTQTAVKYPLLKNIKSLEFKFLDGEKDNWHNRWDTVGMDHKNKFPAIIEVTVDIFTPNTRSTKAEGTAPDERATLRVIQRYRAELPI